MEEKQFLQLVSENQAIIHKICVLYRDTPQDRKDLFQEIIFQLWKSIDSFRNQSKVSTFIYRIALNTSIATFRNDKTKKIIQFTDQLPEIPIQTEDVNFSKRLEALTIAMKKLEEADRAIMAMLLEEMSYREIAEIIGTSENNVAVKISRIKNRIRKLLIP
ncbi:RNA polymerase sigma factor [Pedobacter psychroterrae]|uniref:RNA polymerase sigma factor n=1 Tax=Pedobacter psychroterrae TaxID=2530453 RepID=A0A4R0NRW2_9SPHI|nr:RNA polymerase sigma factor [Pedobacter psychroterrae]TCD03871.1 RNA polymerase sigma factor [Pedobacter psychroterrae]